MVTVPLYPTSHTQSEGAFDAVASVVACAGHGVQVALAPPVPNEPTAHGLHWSPTFLSVPL